MQNHTTGNSEIRAADLPLEENVHAELDVLRRRLAALERKPHGQVNRGRATRNGVAALIAVVVLTLLVNAPIVHGQSVVDALFISAEGNVGIGTTNPTTKLDIEGNLRLGSKVNGKYKLNFGDGDHVYLYEFEDDKLEIRATELKLTSGNVTASSFVGNGTIPVGGIIMWSGSVADIPAGWALCNGAEGTPDLTNRFVVGAGFSYNPGIYGGNTASTIGARHLPSFDVSIFSGTNSPKVSGGGSTPAGGGYYLNNPRDGIGQGLIRLTNRQTFSNDPLPIMPPYYALAFIMRTQ